MAHFAELKSKVDPTGFTNDTHQVVERVVVVGNDIPANGGTLEIMINMLTEKHGVQISSKVEAGNKLLTIIILENNTQVLDTFTIQLKINF